MVTVSPVVALEGANDEIVGGGKNVNPASVAVPPRVIMVISPDVPSPTIAVIDTSDSTLYDAARVPPKLTEEASVK